MRRLLLVRHAPTAATRAGAFPADEPLDEETATALVTPLAAALPEEHEALCSPARRARQTAAAAGLHARPDARLAECDFGAWAGRSLADVHAEDPAGAQRWMTDPQARPHGGESLAELCARVAAWLGEQASYGEGCVVAVTHGGVVRASVAHALGAPPQAAWRVAAQPLGITELHGHDGRWTLERVNCPAGELAR